MDEHGGPSEPVIDINTHVPTQRRKVGDGQQSAQHAVRQDSPKSQIDHSLFILFQTAQKPAAAPVKTNAALQKTPVLKVRSSHRPTKAPSRIGPTIVHPKRPIIASARPSGHSPVCSQCSRLRRARSTASPNSCSSRLRSRSSGSFPFTTEGPAATLAAFP